MTKHLRRSAGCITINAGEIHNMDKQCSNCRHYTDGVTDRQRKEWSSTNLGQWATGICNLYFPRGYIGRKPPHPTLASGHCFQWEDPDGSQQMEIES